MYPVDTYNFLLAISTVILQALAIGLLATFFLRKKYPSLNGIVACAGRWGLWIGFLFSLAGAFITIFYSDVLGYAACEWCWFQRVFLYPQIILFALALWKRDTRIADYSIALSAFGLVVALYQHYLQLGGASFVSCGPTTAADCAQRVFFEFGYITYPLTAASLFAFLIVVMLFVRLRRND